MNGIQTIDCRYLDQSEIAAAYLVVEGHEAAFVEVNTVHALPHLLAALESASLTPADVRWVIVTHAHLDHAGGAWSVLEHCPNATLLAHPRAAPHLIDPSKLVASATEVYGAATFAELYGDLKPIPAARVRVMDDGEVLAWGDRKLTFLHTPGHANHHFCIHDSASNSLFTGDTLGLCYPKLQERGRWVFASTSPTDFDGPAAMASLERLVATGADRAWLTHFGLVDDVPGIAAELLVQLQRCTALVQDADASGLDGADLEAHVLAVVQGWFHEAARVRGLDGDPEVAALLQMDIDLNAQGLAFAVKKARYKRSR